METTAATPRLRIAGLKSPLAGPFDLAISPGECVGVTGASGAGKSLLLRMICDLDPNEGEAWLDGAARSGMPAPAWRRQVLYVPAESGWWDERIAAHFAKDQRQAAGELIGRLGLPPDIPNGSVSRLSTGERQRLSLTRALLMASPVLLLDEPTSALDGGGQARVEEILMERTATGMALVLVTHDPGQAVRLANRRFIMADRRLTAAP